MRNWIKAGIVTLSGAGFLLLLIYIGKIAFTTNEEVAGWTIFSIIWLVICTAGIKGCFDEWDRRRER